ncbi:hypothetical protein V6N13_103288 [Hibiscus sabdariffa]|uniref:Uncharacterized protein n=1 Tax=Hibiscus sabdariffa TaxID=183260 RepID=A0ABR2C582_9ROSI
MRCSCNGPVVPFFLSVIMSCLTMLVLLFLLSLASSDMNQGGFSFNGYLSVDGAAGVDSSMSSKARVALLEPGGSG